MRSAKHGMMKAIQHDDLNLVKQLYNYNLCAQWSNESSMTLLSVACKQGNVAIVTWFVETAKVDVNERNKSGYPPLFCCANADVMCVLLRNGADVHARVRWCNPSSWDGPVRRTGVDVQGDGINALTWAGCYQDNQECAKLLFDAGLDLQKGHEVPFWLQHMKSQVDAVHKCRKAILCVLVAKRFHGYFPRVPYDVMKMVARFVWKSRTDLDLWSSNTGTTTYC